MPVDMYACGEGVMGGERGVKKEEEEASLNDTRAARGVTQGGG